ncbi:hypothetical protein BTM36_13045 [Herbaspirillum sp. VT-16-41]|nr:hypothetical protein BTM36_13045 [Herbaspirillum sp. VT-16-41]
MDLDIRSLNLTFSGAIASEDRIWYSSSASVSLDSSTTFSLGIGGVRDLTMVLKRANTSGATTDPASIVVSKSNGDSLGRVEIAAILESLKFRTNSKDGSARFIDATLTDQAGNISPSARVEIKLTGIKPTPTWSTTLIDPKQAAFEVLNLKDIFGTNNPAVLEKDEEIVIDNPNGLTAADFLSRIKGLSAAWSGQGISNAADTLDEATRSYLGFNAPIPRDAVLSFGRQNGTKVSSVALKFSIKNIGGVDKVVLSSIRESADLSNQDLYNAKFDGASTSGNYGIGNINLIYEKTIERPNSKPTVQVQFDNRADVGATFAVLDNGYTIRTATATLSAADRIAGKKILPALDLGVGKHVLTTEYRESTSGTTISSEKIEFTIDSIAKPFLSNLQVKQPGVGGKSVLKNLNSSTTDYATVVDAGIPGDRGVAVYDQGPTFTGTLGTVNPDGTKTSTGKYLVKATAGDKLLGFDTIDLGAASGTGTFEIKTAASLLKPGIYSDLAFTATELTPGSASNGQSTTVGDLRLGYYWLPQKLENVVGRDGNDEILLGTTKDGRATTITTRGGKDSLIVGKSNNAGTSMEATITDFQLGQDTVKVLQRNGDNSLGYQIITSENWRQFAKQADQSNDGSRGTKLVIDLDGGGAGTDKYTLYLPTVPFNYEANTKSIFGL